tara:strand:+ start:453 stop:725 length:273 start_codon:yes stop_codon:yes gene_type:complete
MRIIINISTINYGTNAFNKLIHHPLREGFEAMLIAMLVFMYLDKVKARHKRPAVFWGMGAGVLVSLLIAVGFKQIVGLTQERMKNYLKVV